MAHSSYIYFLGMALSCKSWYKGLLSTSLILSTAFSTVPRLTQSSLTAFLTLKITSSSCSSRTWAPQVNCIIWPKMTSVAVNSLANCCQPVNLAGIHLWLEHRYQLKRVQGLQFHKFSLSLCGACTLSLFIQLDESPSKFQTLAGQTPGGCMASCLLLSTRRRPTDITSLLLGEGTVC